jgi:hypothetical protein
MCSIRQKAGVETRIEHADGAASIASGNHDARPPRCSRPRLHDNLDVAPEQNEKPNKSIEREPGKPTSSQSRDLRLVDFEQRGSGSLRQSAALDDRPNLPRQLGLGQRFRRPRMSQIREDVAATNDVSLFRHVLTPSVR